MAANGTGVGAALPTATLLEGTGAVRGVANATSATPSARIMMEVAHQVVCLDASNLVEGSLQLLLGVFFGWFFLILLGVPPSALGEGLLVTALRTHAGRGGFNPEQEGPKYR